MRAIIIGAGIGGLTAGLALRRAGIAVEIFEQADAITEAGAGIQVSPNASRLLHRYGLGPALEAVAVRPAGIELRRWQDGTLLARDELGYAVESRYGAPYLHVHRADLADLLAQAFGLHAIRFNHKLAGLEERAGRVTARFSNGATAEADVLVGADGIHSRVRTLLFGAEQARFSGNVAYRGLAPAERLASLGLQRTTTCWMGPGRHLVHYFVSGGRLVNFVAVVEEGSWLREQWSDPAEPGEASSRFADWHPQVRAVIAAAGTTYKWALFDREPLPRWSAGHVTLLGDACHPMLPFIAQGAAQAMEDAACLATVLATAHDIPAALAAYEERRRPRTAAAQAASRGNAATFHLPDGPDQQARDARLAAEGFRGGREREAALYGHDAEAA